MARRAWTPKVKEPKHNPHDVQHVFSAHRKATIYRAARVYAAQVKMPHAERVEDFSVFGEDATGLALKSPFIDQVFGHPTLCAMATRAWDWNHDMAQFVATGQGALDELYPTHPSVLLELHGTRRSPNFLIPARGGRPAVVFNTLMVTTYPADNPPYSWSLSEHSGYRHRLENRGCINVPVHAVRAVDFADLTDSEAAGVEELREWAITVGKASRTAARAYQFVCYAVEASATGRALYSALPGLDAVVERMEHVPEGYVVDYINRTCGPAVAKRDVFNAAHMRSYYESWAAEWLEVRGILMALAVASGHRPHIPLDTVAGVYSYTPPED